MNSESAAPSGASAASPATPGESSSRPAAHPATPGAPPATPGAPPATPGAPPATPGAPPGTPEAPSATSAAPRGNPAGCPRPAGSFDPSVPNVARIYDYVLGGKDNFAADRAFVDRGIPFVPDFPLVVRANRSFLGRAVRYLADCGIEQFLDIGTGLPTAENVHEVVHRVNPAGRVVYVDNDDVVLTHARALLAHKPNVAAAKGDLRDPGTLLEAPEIRQLIDFGRPLAVLMVAVLHFVTDAHRPHEIVARFRDAIAPGSYLAISHAEYRERLEVPASMYRRLANEAASLRSRAEIARFFNGFELVEPGLVPVSQWRPEARLPGADEVWFAAGVGRKPGSRRS